MPGTKYQRASLEITRLSHEGRGIAHLNGKTVFVDNALVSEIVDVEIYQQNRQYFQAKTLQVTNPSPYRVQPKCPYTDFCGGCQAQHIQSDYQVSLKQQETLSQLQHTAKINLQHLEILTPITANPWHYRHKARLSVKYVKKKSALLIGFHEKNGRYIADISHCEVLHPAIGLAIENLKSLVASLSICQQIPQIEVACGENACALIFRHLCDFSSADKQLLKEFAAHYNFHVYLQPNKPEPLIRLFPDEENKNTQFLFYTINQLKFEFFPMDFTQINPAINAQMVNQALTLMDCQPGDQILDLFCGLGNFSLPLASAGGFVTGVEGDIEMVGRARHNAVLNKLSNTEFHAANLFEPDPQMPWLSKKYTKVLIDPPRSGAMEILPFIAKMQPEKILYVSCNPATLARDADILVNHYNYCLTALCVIDMFPHTKHIENMALFSRPKKSKN